MKRDARCSLQAAALLNILMEYYIGASYYYQILLLERLMLTSFEIIPNSSESQVEDLHTQYFWSSEVSW